MKRLVSETKFILVILAIVTVLSGLSNVETESEFKIMSKHEDLKLAVEEMSDEKPIKRSLASIQDVTSSVIDQSFFCNHSLNEAKSINRIDSSMVMLNFKVCKDLKGIESISLVNQSNGFKAQIFKNTNANFKTDFIQLSNGVNNLVIEVVLKDGQKNTDSLVILTGS